MAKIKILKLLISKLLKILSFLVVFVEKSISFLSFQDENVSMMGMVVLAIITFFGQVWSHIMSQNYDDV